MHSPQALRPSLVQPFRPTSLPSLRLKGSELLQSLELDKRFVLYFHTALTWQPSGGGGGGGGSSSANGGHGSNGGGGNGGGAVAAAGQGSINAMADVQVWSEVVGPFRVIPRPMLQVSSGILCREPEGTACLQRHVQERSLPCSAGMR